MDRHHGPRSRQVPTASAEVPQQASSTFLHSRRSGNGLVKDDPQPQFSVVRVCQGSRVELSAAVWALANGELVERLERLHTLAQQVAAAQLAVVREIDGRGLAVLEGASSTRVWLRDRLRISVQAADR